MTMSAVAFVQGSSLVAEKLSMLSLFSSHWGGWVRVARPETCLSCRVHFRMKGKP
jgi:hypothetical protein